MLKKDMQRLKVPNWKTLVQDRRRWKWLRRPKLCTKSSTAVLRRRRSVINVNRSSSKVCILVRF